MAYELHIVFKSNERPWSGDHTPTLGHQFSGDAEAIKWAVGMAKGLGDAYQVTLFDDGRVVQLPLEE